MNLDDGLTKRQVHTAAPKRIKELQFGLFPPEDIVKQGVVEICDRSVYNLTPTTGNARPITRHGPLDPRMGTSMNSGTCETCRLNLKHCNGHFGYVKLALPAFHIGYLKKVIEVLNCICKECSRVLLNEKATRDFLRSVRRASRENLEHKKVVKKIMLECRKSKQCPYCHATNGTIKKVSGHALKLIHDKFRAFDQSTAKNKKPPPDKEAFDDAFLEVKKHNPEIEKHFRKALDDMNPLRVLHLFQNIRPADCELLGMHYDKARPESLLWQYVPIPPVSIRPSVAQEGATTEDDLTNKLGDVVEMSRTIKTGIEAGKPIQQLMEQWDFMQLQLAMYVNSEIPSLQQAGFGKPIRGLCQRLKGKQGRFRGNLSGKRVDFSGRTVISPDPNLAIDEVGVPERVAKNMTYPERVTSLNLNEMRMRVRRGPHRHPGANSVERPGTNFRINLHALAKFNRLEGAVNQLKVGDIVHRHLIDGDIVLFNRQPSLHKLSILSHRVKVRHWRTFKLNECVCTPYNADFDGDEMNLHVPQTEEARIEARELMGVQHNLATPKDGTPIIAATQDFITAAFLLSRKDRFYDRRQFAQICGFMFDGLGAQAGNGDVPQRHAIALPEPTIIKPEALWTGKQVFNVMMRPTKDSEVLVNFDAVCKQYKKNEESDYNRSDDLFMCVRNSEVLSGVMDKNILGSGKKDSIFYVLLRDFGPDAAAQAMNRLAKLSARWLSNEGFSIGISDVFPGRRLVENKQKIVKEAYAKADEIIKDFNNNKLKRDAGCDEEQTMENRISGLLSKVREKAGDICFNELSTWNAPIIMAKSGSKGSPLNVAQMVATVGQQIINSSRVADGFQDRTLPHFPKAARQPPSKGFVQSSFFSGLGPTEFIFHAMSGREGLVDTAVKTAETGYMSRRLMKSLEDLAAQYDDTVRNAASGIVQFQFGADGLDPVDMEGRAKPVNLERTWLHAQTSKWKHAEVSLLPIQIRKQSEKYLQRHKDKYNRRTLDGSEELSYDDCGPDDVYADQFESRREFLKEVENFVDARAGDLARVRDFLQLGDGPKRGRPPKGGASRKKQEDALTVIASNVAKVSESQLQHYLDLCMHKYEKAKVEPGHAVGAVGAQSIGEPGTQMTLKTFHFAGVAGMSITQGVPRIKEIINASKVISTPVITCFLTSASSERAARMVKSRIEKTYLRDVIEYIEECWHGNQRVIKIKVDTENISNLHLDLYISEIRHTLQHSHHLKLLPQSVMRKKGDIILIKPDGAEEDAFDMDVAGKAKRKRTRSKALDEDTDLFLHLQTLKRRLPDIAIKGLPDAARAVITKTGEKDGEGRETNKLMVEGYGFRACLSTPGVEFRQTVTNNIDEIHRVLGIEAARVSIIKELNFVMGQQMDIDPRHMQLLADIMTYKGDVLGITRFGLAKMRDSVLQLASFEKTPDHLFDAAIRGQSDKIEGVSECIIMGQPMRIGTGAVGTVRPMGFTDEDFAQKPTAFEDCCLGARR